MAYEVEDVEVITETDGAILITSDDTGEVWVPKSQIEEESEVSEAGDEGPLVVTDGFARKQGWI